MKEVGEGPWVLGSLRQHAQWSFFKWSQRSRCQRGFLARHPIYTVAQAWLNPTPNTGQTTLYVLRPPVLVCGGNLVPVSGYPLLGVAKPWAFRSRTGVGSLFGMVITCPSKSKDVTASWDMGRDMCTKRHF